MASAPMPTILIPPSSRPARMRWPRLFEAWIPVMLFAGILALESSAALGANHTSAPLHSLCHAVLGSRVDRHWPLFHFAIRKVGHFAGYGLFSVLVLRALRRTLSRFTLAPFAHQALAIAATLAAAAADEFHQSFLPNRTGSMHDVLLDIAGALSLQLALWFLLRNRRPRSPRLYRTASQIPGPMFVYVE